MRTRSVLKNCKDLHMLASSSTSVTKHSSAHACARTSSRSTTLRTRAHAARRDVLLLSTLLSVAPPAHAASQPSLRALLDSPPESADIRNPGLSWALSNNDRQLRYPSWMEGSFQVHATFAGAGFPLGQRFINKNLPGVTKGSMIVAIADVGAAMDRSVSFNSRFNYSQAEKGVVADRQFNIQQQADALLGYPAVQGVSYEPLKNPTRLNVVWATPRKSSNLEPLKAFDQRKAEIFINNRLAEDASSSQQGGNDWCGLELFRQVSQAARQGSVGDYMAITCFHPSDASPRPASVAGRLRVAAFLQPQDPLYFETNGRAVAVYDYALDMKRVS